MSLLRASTIIGSAIIEAAKILAAKSDRLCCQDGTVVIEHDGQLWLHRLEWTADQWAPLGMPGTSSFEPEKVKPAKRIRRR